MYSCLWCKQTLSFSLICRSSVMAPTPSTSTRSDDWAHKSFGKQCNSSTIYHHQISIDEIIIIRSSRGRDGSRDDEMWKEFGTRSWWTDRRRRPSPCRRLWWTPELDARQQGLCSSRSPAAGQGVVVAPAHTCVDLTYGVAGARVSVRDLWNSTPFFALFVPSYPRTWEIKGSVPMYGSSQHRPMVFSLWTVF